VKNLTRRNFLKFGAAGTAGLAAALNFPMLGRMVLAQSGSNYFTIGVISDTQNYADGRFQPASNGVYNLPFFIDQTTYLANNISALNLAFVTHVGDVVQNGDGSTLVYPAKGGYPEGSPQDCEWLNAQQAIAILAASGVPFGMSPGNHDYDNMDYSGADAYPPLVSTAPWWKDTWGSGSQYFAGKSWYGGASDELGYISTGSGAKGMWKPAGTVCNCGLSSYQLFSACGMKFLHISLEMEAGNAALAWAQGVINLYPGYPTIVTTHSYLSPPAWTDSSPPALQNPAAAGTTKAPYNANSYLTNSPAGWNKAQAVFNTLIAPNNQIFLVLCGHSWTSTEPASAAPYAGFSKGENIRIDNNNAGNPVYQVLTDYQGNTTFGSQGGDGWYRFMQFDMDTNSIHFYTYNAYNTDYAGTNLVNGENAFNQVPAFSDFSLAMPVQVLNAPAQVDIVASGFVYSRASKLYTGNLILTNTSVNPITNQVAVALNNLTSGVTLVNQAGSNNGAPYATVANSGLAAGASLIIPVQFSDPSNAKINFTPVMFQE
jgi:hypothetical protein